MNGSDGSIALGLREFSPAYGWPEIFVQGAYSRCTAAQLYTPSGLEYASLATQLSIKLAPMREIATVFGALLGVVILKETQGRSRLVASILITLGIILLAQ